MFRFLFLIWLFIPLTAFAQSSSTLENQTRWQEETESELRSIREGLSAYFQDNGIFPTVEQGLAALVIPPTTFPFAAHWNGLYVQRSLKQLLHDAWGKEYQYTLEGDSSQEDWFHYQKNPIAVIRSSGTDRKMNTNDDLIMKLEGAPLALFLI